MLAFGDEFARGLFVKIFAVQQLLLLALALRYFLLELGAAGGVECIATALAVENDMLPPTINFSEPDLEEGLDLDYVPNQARAHTVRAAISNNFGFGGHNACLVLKKFAP